MNEQNFKYADNILDSKNINNAIFQTGDEICSPGEH